MPGELIFGEQAWQAVLFGVLLAVFIGFIVLCAMYPVMLFARQVWRSIR